MIKDVIVVLALILSLIGSVAVILGVLWATGDIKIFYSGREWTWRLRWTK